HRDMSHRVTSHPSGFSSTSPTYSSFPLWVLLVVVRDDPVQCPGKVRTPVCVFRPDALLYLCHSFSHFPDPSGTSSFLPTISTLAQFTSCQSCTSHSGLHPPPSRLVLRTPIFRSGPDLLDRLGPSALLCYPVLLCHSVYPLSSYSTFGLPFVIFKSLVPF
ncbi:hypothetical protein C8R43DRAFT_986163, partial [Mycena crocata]